MAYATVQDMIQKFGTSEMIRLSVPDGQDMDSIVADVIERAAADASALMDSYIRKRYRTPLDVPPQEVVAKCCDIARFELSSGDQKQPSDQVTRRHDQALDWLRDIAKGVVTLELDEVAPGDESYAQMDARKPVFGRGRF